MNEGYIDLHTHSTASDGSLSPRELVRYAKTKPGLNAIALTDHDTLDGLHEALAEGQAQGLEVVPGIEITTVVEGCDVHILGLLIDPDSAVLRAACVQFAASRARRNEAMLKKLESAGINIHASDFSSLGNREISRNHFARLLVERGYAKDRADANNRYFLPGGLAYTRRETPSPAECISTIRAAGGLAFVAHVNQIDPKDSEHSLSVLRKIIGWGADGLETRYCEYDLYWQKTLELYAEQCHLLCSGGSDFHGSYKPGLDLMTGYGGLRVPYAFLQSMRAVHDRKLVGRSR